MYKVVERFRSISQPLSKYVIASSNSYYSSTPPSNVLYDNSSIYHSSGSSGAYIEIKFIRYKVKIDKIIIQLTTNQDPVHWRIDAAKDGNNYEPIYTNNDAKICDKFVTKPEYAYAGSVYCGYEAIGTFSVSRGIYKSFKIVQTGCSSYPGQYILALRRIEVLGAIMFPDTEKKRIYTNHIPFFIFLIL